MTIQNCTTSSIPPLTVEKRRMAGIRDKAVFIAAVTLAAFCNKAPQDVLTLFNIKATHSIEKVQSAVTSADGAVEQSPSSSVSEMPDAALATAQGAAKPSTSREEALEKLQQLKGLIIAQKRAPESSWVELMEKFDQLLDPTVVNESCDVGIPRTLLNLVGQLVLPKGFYEKTKIIARFAARGAEFNIYDSLGNTPLMWAIANANNTCPMEMLSLAKDVLESGKPILDPDLRDRGPFGNSALHLAVGKGYTMRSADGLELSYSNLTLAQALTDLGANVNLSNKDGNTPLHLAFLRRDVEMVHFLVQQGARFDVRNKQGKTPLEMLKVSYEDACQLLKDQVVVFLLNKALFEANLPKLKRYTLFPEGIGSWDLIGS